MPYLESFNFTENYAKLDSLQCERQQQQRNIYHFKNFHKTEQRAYVTEDKLIPLLRESASVLDWSTKCCQEILHIKRQTTSWIKLPLKLAKVQSYMC